MTRREAHGTPQAGEHAMADCRDVLPSPPSTPDGAGPSAPGGALHTREHSPLRLGLRVNLRQFLLLATITFGVGLVVGAERVVVPVLAKQAFHVASFLALLAFIVSFGFVKAALNLVAGRLADRAGRKRLLIAGWLFALPIPFMIIFAPAW